MCPYGDNGEDNIENEYLRNEKSRYSDKFLYYDKEFWQNQNLDEPVDKRDKTVKFWHVRQAILNLVKRYKKDGPFTYKQFATSLHDVIVSEDLWSLVKNGLIEVAIDTKTDQFVFLPTELGKQSKRKS